MATLSSVFSRISAGAPKVSADGAQKRLMKAGGFGWLSLTGGMVKAGIGKALAKADSNGDGNVDAGEFATAVRVAEKGRKLPTWDQMDPGGVGSLSRDDLAELVKAMAQKKGGALAGMIDAQGVAKIAVALLDDDGDARVSKQEFETVVADLG